jgi:phenylacetate-CoA ligase
MRSERLPGHKIQDYQNSQLQQLLAHAAKEVPFYRQSLASIRRPDGSFDLDQWQELPIISRSLVAANWEAFQSENLPAGHRAIIESTTSGSEGLRLKMRKTRFEHTGVACASYRYAQWFSYDYRIPLAMIRAGFIRTADPNDPEDNRWGPPWLPAEQRSSRHRLSINTPICEQLKWLEGLGRVYLNTLPSNVMALAQLAARTGQKPQLASILTVGERLSTDVRQEVRSILDASISDVYSTAECGLIAIQCPHSGQYHIQSEITKVEIIKPNGDRCLPGETGHVVATSLYNYPMPLIRYRFHDLVVLGDSCSCGRNLPVISQILGREKGLFYLSKGAHILPDFRTQWFRAHVGTPDWQVAQVGPNAVEVRIRKMEPLTDAEKVHIKDYVCNILGASGFEVQSRRVEDFRRTEGGKFYPVLREFV